MEIVEINVYVTVITFVLYTSLMLTYGWHTPVSPADSEANFLLL